jgi:hypothetical protein
MRFRESWILYAAVVAPRDASTSPVKPTITVTNVPIVRITTGAITSSSITVKPYRRFLFLVSIFFVDILILF